MNALDVASQTLRVLIPEIILVVGAAVMLTASAFLRAPRWRWCLRAALLHLLAFAALVALGSQTTDPYSSPVVNDDLALHARLGFLLTGLMLLALSHDRVEEARAGEFFGTLSMLTAGAMLVAGANELILLFLGLELVSIPTYILLYLGKRDDAGREAATKYFFLSLLASSLLLFGMAYLYGLTGTTNLKALSWLIANVPETLSGGSRAFGLIALVFVTAGLSFRLAAVPLQFYAPDVYQGTGTATAALLAWVPKGIGALALIRVLTSVFGGTSALSQAGLALVSFLAIATLLVGNTMALLQDNLKRLLAYSSISHAGYLLIGGAAAFVNGHRPVVGQVLGAEAISLYLASYAFMTIGAFAAILCLRKPDGGEIETVDDLSGLARTRPLVAAGLAICLLSLAGIPPLFGFWGKLAIFAAAIQAGAATGQPALLGLVAIGAVAAAIGAYYYLRLIVVMYVREPKEGALAPAPAPWPTAASLALCAAASLGFWLVAAGSARHAGVGAVELPPAALHAQATAAVALEAAGQAR